MNNQEIVAKLWNLCNVLRDDGITYHQYVTELTPFSIWKLCVSRGSVRPAAPKGSPVDSKARRLLCCQGLRW